MQYDYTTLEDKFKKLPDELQEILTSPKTVEVLKDISKKNGLLIDQEAELFDLTSHVILGMVPATDFAELLSKNAGVSDTVAQAVTNDINHAFQTQLKISIGNSTKAIDTDVDQGQKKSSVWESSSLSPLERVGGFSVEREPDETERKPVTPADRGSILNALENPPMNKAATIVTPPDNLPTSDIGTANTAPGKVATKQKQEDSHIEPLVDYLLSNSVGQSTKTVSSTPKPPLKTAPIQPRPSGGIDPYREPIN